MNHLPYFTKATKNILIYLRSVTHEMYVTNVIGNIPLVCNSFSDTYDEGIWDQNRRNENKKSSQCI